MLYQFLFDLLPQLRQVFRSQAQNYNFDDLTGKTEFFRSIRGIVTIDIFYAVLASTLSPNSKCYERKLIRLVLRTGLQIQSNNTNLAKTYSKSYISITFFT